jgi:hypothetical protein
MGITQVHALGRFQRAAAKAESVYGTFVKPAGTDAIKVLSMGIEPMIQRRDRIDSRQTRSLMERFTGRHEVSWSLETYLLPSGTATTPPDIGPLLKAAFGVETVGGSNVVYSLSASQAAHGSLSLVREMNAVIMEACWGAVPQVCTITVDGSNDPKISFEGFAKKYAATGTTTLSSSPDASASFTVADPTVLAVNSVVKIGSLDNSGAGYKVTGISGSTITIETTITATSGDAVVPFFPPETVAGDPLAGISGSLAIGSDTLVPIVSLEVSLNNNFKVIGDEALTDSVTDYIAFTREVTGSLSIRARKDHLKWLASRPQFTAHDLEIIVGETAGKRFKIDIPKAEFEFEALEVPEAEEAVMSLPFRALGTSGDDEITLTQY